jgi:hypothetical protein
MGHPSGRGPVLGREPPKGKSTPGGVSPTSDGLGCQNPPLTGTTCGPQRKAVLNKVFA